MCWDIVPNCPLFWSSFTNVILTKFPPLAALVVVILIYIYVLGCRTHISMYLENFEPSVLMGNMLKWVPKIAIVLTLCFLAFSFIPEMKGVYLKARMSLEYKAYASYCTAHAKNYAHSFAFCCGFVKAEFTHILQGYFTGTEQPYHFWEWLKSQAHIHTITIFPFPAQIITHMLYWIDYHSPPSFLKG